MVQKPFQRQYLSLFQFRTKTKKKQKQEIQARKEKKKKRKKNIINGRYVHFAWVFPAARRPDLKTDGFVEAKRTPRVRRVGSPPPRRPLKRNRV